jgi:SAM-dependent methyltransferase
VSAVLRRADGDVIDLDVARWHDDADADEVELLARVPDPVLDIGCGPGRAVAALAARGRLALGIDREPRAVAAALERGATALERSVFDPLPGEGRWGAALLLDGNIGIGGDPVRLLARVHDLLAPGGCLLAEVLAPHVASEPVTVRVEVGRGQAPGPWFRWARVSARDAARLIHRAGLRCTGAERVAGDRWFVWGRKP